MSEEPDIPAEEVESEAFVLVQGVRRAEPAMPLLLHGEERSAWPALELAGRLDWTGEQGWRIW